MKMILSGDDWQVKGFDQYVPIKETSMETGIELTGVTDWIKSEVPGGIHSDLYRSAEIENPICDINSLHAEWIERRWWMYKKTFDFDLDDAQYELVFEGIDYEASFYLNGTHLGDHKGMFTKAIFDIGDIVVPKDNIVVVVFRHAPDEMGQIGYTSKSSTQKSRFNYKWDFSARIVNIGIWKDVYIKKREAAQITNLYIQSDYDLNNAGTIKIDFDLESKTPLQESVKVEYILSDPMGNEIVKECIDVMQKDGAHKVIGIENPYLWDVNGNGVAHLYCIEVKVSYKGDIVDTATKKIGIRSIEYLQNETKCINPLPYTFAINGKRVYVKGVNITPLDTMYGSVKDEQYGQLVRQAVNANVNLIRVWGGGLIEKEIFYNLCDENGILVWQDFIQSSSGIDNVPCHDEAFLDILKEASREGIMEKRNHTSLACWCGGNELMDLDGVPITYDDPNINMLQKLVKKYNPQIFFYPSTASGPSEFLSDDKENHDIHGSWEHKGNPLHYKTYGKSDSLFHSEFGTEGLASLKSIRKFISPEYRYPSEMNKNKVYKNHGAWWGTYRRDTKLFFELNDMKEFVDCGQYMHAEGLRFILEANRRRKFENSGSIIWQLNEPFPNVSCTSLIDYFGECKPVYYYAKKSYKNRHISLSYEKLDYLPGHKFCGKIYVSNSHEAFDAKAQVCVYDVSGNCLYEKKINCYADENRTTEIGALEHEISKKGLFIVILKLYDENVVIDDNRYVFSTDKDHPYKRFSDLDAKVEIVSCEILEDGKDKQVSKVVIKNRGTTFAPMSGIQLIDNCYYLLCDDNLFEMLPEEEQVIIAQVYPKKVGSFIYNETFTGEKITATFTTRYFGKKDEM